MFQTEKSGPNGGLIWLMRKERRKRSPSVHKQPHLCQSPLSVCKQSECFPDCYRKRWTQIIRNKKTKTKAKMSQLWWYITHWFSHSESKLEPQPLNPSQLRLGFLQTRPEQRMQHNLASSMDHGEIPICALTLREAGPLWIMRSGTQFWV